MFHLKIHCVSCQAVFDRAAPLPMYGTLCPACGAPVSVPRAFGPAAYYVRRASHQWGPFALPELKELAVSNQLLATDIVIAAGADRGHAACLLPYLFPAARTEDDEPLLVMEQVLKSALPASLAATLDARMDATLSGAVDTTATEAERGSIAGLCVGDFQIRRRLGAGGMGTVFLAQQRSQDRPVALKVLAEGMARRRDFVARFHRE